MTAQNPALTQLEDEVAALEASLLNARARLKSQLSSSPASAPTPSHLTSSDTPLKLGTIHSSTFHTLLILADSALPLGSFAFSSGLESYLAHHPPRAPFPPFLALSVASLASTALPYVLAAYRTPQSLEELDNDFDASTPCTVARRASVAQGRALLGVWERALRGAAGEAPARTDRNGPEAPKNMSDGATAITAAEALVTFNQALKTAPMVASTTPLNGHIAPLWGLVCRSQRLELQDSAYIFLLNHAKAVLSAAVRAAVLGPYAAQGLLASGWLRGLLEDAIRVNWEVEVEEAGQCAPLLDLWVGRHELLYSRIFNS